MPDPTLPVRRAEFDDNFARGFQGSFTPLTPTTGRADLLYRHPFTVGDHVHVMTFPMQYLPWIATSAPVVTEVVGRSVTIAWDAPGHPALSPVAVSGWITERISDAAARVTLPGVAAADADELLLHGAQQNILLRWAGGERRFMRSATVVYGFPPVEVLALRGGEGDPLPAVDTPVEVVLQTRLRLVPVGDGSTRLLTDANVAWWNGPWRPESGTWRVGHEWAPVPGYPGGPSPLGVWTADRGAKLALLTGFAGPGQSFKIVRRGAADAVYRIVWGDPAGDNWTLELTQGPAEHLDRYLIRLLHGGAMVGGWTDTGDVLGTEYPLGPLHEMYLAAWEEPEDDQVNITFGTELVRTCVRVPTGSFTGGPVAIEVDSPAGQPVGVYRFETGRDDPGVGLVRARTLPAASRDDVPCSYRVEITGGLHDGGPVSGRDQYGNPVTYQTLFGSMLNGLVRDALHLYSWQSANPTGPVLADRWHFAGGYHGVTISLAKGEGGYGLSVGLTLAVPTEITDVWGTTTLGVVNFAFGCAIDLGTGRPDLRALDDFEAICLPGSMAPELGSSIGIPSVRVRPSFDRPAWTWCTPNPTKPYPDSIVMDVEGLGEWAVEHGFPAPPTKLGLQWAAGEHGWSEFVSYAFQAEGDFDVLGHWRVTASVAATGDSLFRGRHAAVTCSVLYEVGYRTPGETPGQESWKNYKWTASWRLPWRAPLADLAGERPQQMSSFRYFGYTDDEGLYHEDAAYFFTTGCLLTASD